MLQQHGTLSLPLVVHVYSTYSAYSCSVISKKCTNTGLKSTQVTVILPCYICCIKRAGSTLHWVAWLDGTMDCHFFISISLQPSGVNLRLFKLWILFGQIIKVWNIKGLHHLVAKIKGLQNLSLWQKIILFSLIM